jgi:hypothetical protein
MSAREKRLQVEGWRSKVDPDFGQALDALPADRSSLMAHRYPLIADC